MPGRETKATNNYTPSFQKLLAGNSASDHSLIAEPSNPIYSANGTTLRNSFSSYNLINGFSKTNADTPLLSLPLVFIRNGRYQYDTGVLYNRGGGGNFWSSRAVSSSTPTDSYFLYFSSTYLSPQNNFNKGYGLAVRCVAR